MTYIDIFHAEPRQRSRGPTVCRKCTAVARELDIRHPNQHRIATAIRAGEKDGGPSVGVVGHVAGGEPR